MSLHAYDVHLSETNEMVEDDYYAGYFDRSLNSTEKTARDQHQIDKYLNNRFIWRKNHVQKSIAMPYIELSDLNNK